ncbi:hypothetical protein HPB50_005331 [Hyalomma asiaticum]|uniref:Uncharacterized protein n=1 Tax=Hyalomma asiaticum TaxID=266040 RepID=A0ACB7RKA5_HYAAI|nr:hypothetical protein HPB50_005331 [Hyalomma asiaticum]
MYVIQAGTVTRDVIPQAILGNGIVETVHTDSLHSLIARHNITFRTASVSESLEVAPDTHLKWKCRKYLKRGNQDRSNFTAHRYRQTPEESEEEDTDQSRTNYTRRVYSVSPSGTRGHLSRTDSGSRRRTEEDRIGGRRGSARYDEWSRRTSTDKPDEADGSRPTYIRRTESTTRHRWSSRSGSEDDASLSLQSRRYGSAESLSGRHQWSATTEQPAHETTSVYEGRRLSVDRATSQHRWPGQYSTDRPDRPAYPHHRSSYDRPSSRRTWSSHSATERTSWSASEVSSTTTDTPEVDKSGSTYVRQQYHSITAGVHHSTSGRPATSSEAPRREHWGAGGQRQVDTAGYGRESDRDGSRRWSSHRVTSAEDTASRGQEERRWSWRGYNARFGEHGNTTHRVDVGSRTRFQPTVIGPPSRTEYDGTSVHQRHRVTAWRNTTIVSGVPTHWSEDTQRRYGGHDDVRRGPGEDTTYTRTSYTRRINGTTYYGGGQHSSHWMYGRDNATSGSSVTYGSSRASGTYGGVEGQTEPPYIPPRPTETHIVTGGVDVDIAEDNRHPLTVQSRGSQPHACEESSCYPATGNLLIGREDKLSATSTCGLRGVETYCIVSHLKEKTKCFRCDSTKKGRDYHGIDNIVSRIGKKRKGSWWQSENGVQSVSIRLDLEAEFHFTHLIITFKTFRPAAMLIERSHDNGHTWKVYQYFAYDCAESFPHVRYGPRRNITDVTCESHYSGVEPSTNGEVFGKCQCTHNTKGLNCESCEDLYNDQPWRPASERDPNPCKPCNCNGHANKCHFDAAVWERSGRVSGGVCDDCQDNTMGLNCEQCVPFYFKDPQRDISDPYACQPCDCDPRGSLDEGVCDPQDDPTSGLVAGRCHCKKNVESRRCDRCKKASSTSRQLTLMGASVSVTVLRTLFVDAAYDGKVETNVNPCHELGTAGDGCNVYTGECTCKRNVIGRDCNQCLPEYYGLSHDDDGCKPCDCDPGGAYENSCDVITGQCRCRPSVQGRRCDQPDTGFFVGNLDYMVHEAELAKGSPDCQVLVREPYADREASWTGLGFMQVHQDSYLEFDVPDIPTSMDYNIVFRYEPKLPQGWEEAIVTVDRPGPVDPNGPCANAILQDDRQVIRFSAGKSMLFSELICSDRYVVVAPPVCLEKGRHYKVRVTFKQYDREVDTPSASILIDSMVLMPDINAIPFFHGTPANEYRREEFERFRCGQAFYAVRRGGTLPEICKKYLYSIGVYVFQGAQDCRCDPQGSHSSVCNTLGGQCQCKTNVVGRSCDRCAPGTYGFGPGGCRPCDCNGIGSLDNFCDAQTGQCKCRPNTYGRQCDECQPGFWNYPNCQRCDCNGHADTCDSRTGHCIQCRDFTSGPHCDRFLYLYEYSAVNRFGQCPCLPNVEGISCDRCAPNYWKIASGEGCEACGCDPLGSYDLKCNEFDGQCPCKPGHGGRQCNQCQDNHWGDPRVRCYQCECNVPGAATSQCHRNNGSCVCIPGVAGDRCQQCARGFTGRAPYCNSCGECFDNWDRIIQELREETQNMINSARQIKQQGTTGVYTREFQEMEEKLHEVEEILNGANITGLDLLDRQSLIEEIRRNLTESQMQLEEIGDRSGNVTQRSFATNLMLASLHEQAQELGRDAKALRENTTALQEANVEGALNITREAQKRSQMAEGRVRGAQDDIGKSQATRRFIEKKLHDTAAAYNRTYQENENALRKLQQEVADLEDQISDVNELVCYRRGTVDRCDALCGGAGCNHCGGLGCEEGALTRANNTLTMAVDANQILGKKEADARDLFNAVGSAEKESQRALEEAKKAFARSQLAKNQSEEVGTDLQDLLDRIDKFLSEVGARPAEIRVLAEECIALTISLKPEQIRELAKEINDTISSLTDIDAILRETGEDLRLAKDLKAQADRARTMANKILDTAKEVLQNLDDAAEAQGRAKEAIDEARRHINTAEEDLAQIEDAAYKAQGVANRSLDQVGGLQDRLAELKKQFTQNNLDARKAVNEAKGADRLAGQAQHAWRMNLTENEQRLKDYSGILAQLNQEMMSHLDRIDRRSTYYRDCQN